MAKKKNHWYIIVMGSDGPAFVTQVNYGDRTAQWNKDETPIEFDAEIAKDLALGLSLNFHTAFPVCVPYEMEKQPYYYEFGHFEWINDK